MVERLQRSADFERVLKTPSRLRSAHFAAHHLGELPSQPAWRQKGLPAPELSTAGGASALVPVDESPEIPPSAQPELPRPSSLWLGAVVPKRHARRSVTRTALKRQIRAAMTIHEQSLAYGLWVIRLRAPFDRKQFPSATSQALQSAARDELDALIASALKRGLGR